MGLVGADVEQLRTLSQTFSMAADRLRRIASEISGRLSTTRWTGPDAERYRSEWQGQSVGQLTRIADALQGSSAALQRNADEQQGASAAVATTTDDIASSIPNSFNGFRDFTNAAPLWPINNDTLLSMIPGVKTALPYADGTAIAFDSRLSPGDKLVEEGHLGYDTVAGSVRAAATQRADAAGYLLGVAASQWGDVAYYGSKADFSPDTVATVQNYIAADPKGAFDAAVGAVRDYAPKLVSNFSFW